MQLPKQHIVIFDGVCNLCNSSVKYIIKHDKQNKFLFTPLQSKTGQFIFKTFNIDISKIDSIVLYSPNNTISIKSSAALKIAKKLGFPNNLFNVFIIIPRVFRDLVYDYLSKNRYKWFGKKEACMIPTPELKAKFID